MPNINQASFNQINAKKLKGMSKKQLRMIKKTSVNAMGQVRCIYS